MNNVTVLMVLIAPVIPRQASIRYSLLTAVACFDFGIQTVDANIIMDLITIVYSYTLRLDLATISHQRYYLCLPIYPFFRSKILPSSFCKSIECKLYSYTNICTWTFGQLPYINQSWEEPVFGIYFCIVKRLLTCRSSRDVNIHKKQYLLVLLTGSHKTLLKSKNM